jgi:lactate dehydrogenase-like 2-hydroxyacid dehydrogenase
MAKALAPAAKIHNLGVEIREDNMTKRVAVIGAGTIGASWAAIFLARGLDVAATDPSPNGEDASARRKNP